MLSDLLNYPHSTILTQKNQIFVVDYFIFLFLFSFTRYGLVCVILAQIFLPQPSALKIPAYQL